MTFDPLPKDRESDLGSEFLLDQDQKVSFFIFHFIKKNMEKRKIEKW